MINDDAFVSAAMANACFMVRLVCLFVKTHPLPLLQANCLDLVHCAFMREEYYSVLSTPAWPIPIYR